MTKPPRTRENLNTSLPHNAYPGGKILRKRMARLKLRQTGSQNGKRPDRIRSRDDCPPWGDEGYTKPGSMAS
jgi:hypothetical protein